MFRGFILGIIFAIVVAAGAAYLILSSGGIPASTSGGPIPLERFAARTSQRATLEKEAPKGPPPVAATDANLIQGIDLYGPRCAVCHGLADGQPTSIEKGEYPRPPLLAKHGVENDPAGWTFWKIKNGLRWTGMPAWGDELKDDQIWKIALFLKNMNKLSPAAEGAWKALRSPDEAPPTPVDSTAVGPAGKSP